MIEVMRQEFADDNIDRAHNEAIESAAVMIESFIQGSLSISDVSADATTAEIIDAAFNNALRSVALAVRTLKR